MKIQPIQAKQLLSHVKQPDEWFGLKYNMNIYRGCQHQCIYCDTRSECYQIEDFTNEVLYKENALQLLRKELASKRIVGTIGLGSMNDPYMPIEKEYELTKKALQIIAEFGFPVHIITKSNLVLRDLDLLKKINDVYTTISFTITTTDDELAKVVEPEAPSPSNRLKALKILSENNIQAGIVLMPVLPFIEDNEKNIKNIVTNAYQNKAKYILPSFGMTLRDRQRDFYYEKLDKHFPSLKKRYINKFGNDYSCSINNYHTLKKCFYNLCKKYNILTKITPHKKETVEQMTFF